MRFSVLAFLCALLLSTAGFGATVRPNFVWITSEDNGPELGGYGDRIKPLEEVLKSREARSVPWQEDHAWPYDVGQNGNS